MGGVLLFGSQQLFLGQIRGELFMEIFHGPWLLLVYPPFISYALESVAIMAPKEHIYLETPSTIFCFLTYNNT